MLDMSGCGGKDSGGGDATRRDSQLVTELQLPARFIAYNDD